MQAQMSLMQIPLGAESWQAFLTFFTARGVVLPAPPSEALFIGTPAYGVVAGCCLYPTGSRFLLIEHLGTHPGVPMRVRHAAVVELAESALRAACARGQDIIIAARGRGLQAILERAGFRRSPAAVAMIADTSVHAVELKHEGPRRPSPGPNKDQTLARSSMRSSKPLVKRRRK